MKSFLAETVNALSVNISPPRYSTVPLIVISWIVRLPLVEMTKFAFSAINVPPVKVIVLPFGITNPLVFVLVHVFPLKLIVTFLLSAITFSDVFFMRVITLPSVTSSSLRASLSLS